MLAKALVIAMAADIARYHHERFNGKGYPEGLEGGNKPLSARIMALADAYDALRTERYYKEGFSHKKALKSLRRKCLRKKSSIR